MTPPTDEHGQCNRVYCTDPKAHAAPRPIDAIYRAEERLQDGPPTDEARATGWFDPKTGDGFAPDQPEVTCPRCAHRLHEVGECQARYRVTFQPGELGDPCLCEYESVTDEARADDEPGAYEIDDGNGHTYRFSGRADEARIHKRDCLLLDSDPNHEGWCPTNETRWHKLPDGSHSCHAPCQHPPDENRAGEPRTEAGCSIDGSETLRDWALRLADERVAAIVEPHELAHARHRRDELRDALAIEREAAAAPFDRDKVARSLKERYHLRQSVPELMMGLDIAIANGR